MSGLLRSNRTRESQGNHKLKLTVDAQVLVTLSVPGAGLRRRRKWSPPRWRPDNLWGHILFYPTYRQLQYLEAYRRLLGRRQSPTLSRLAESLGVKRQTVWQLEQNHLFRKWLMTELQLWRGGYGYDERVGPKENLRRHRKAHSLAG